MDYLKVPELPSEWELPFAWANPTRIAAESLECVCDTNSRCMVFDCGSQTGKFLVGLLNAVYTPTTGLLAQIEDQKRVIEELRGKVEKLEARDCSSGCRVEKAVKEFYAEA